MDLYKNAIVIKSKPKVNPTPAKKPEPETPAKKSDPGTPAKKSEEPDKETEKAQQASSADIQKILAKEQVLEDLLKQQQQQRQTSPETNDDEQNVAVDFFIKMVKTYFALVIKFGDTVANTVIRMALPAQLAEPIISDTPLNLGDLVKTADRVNQVLAHPDFKSQLRAMVENTSNAVNPQIKLLLNKMADVILDVAGKTGSKLASTAAISLSAFPPLAVAFDIANLVSVGINAVSSGINLVSTTANSGVKVMNAFNSTPGIDMNGLMSKTQEPSKKQVPPSKPKQKGGKKTKQQQPKKRHKRTKRHHR